jgi:hypothetical protein
MDKKIKRRILADLDKTLHTGLVRLELEYELLSCKDGELSVSELERLSTLTRLFIQIKNDKSLEDLKEINRGRQKPRSSPVSPINQSIDDITK